MASALYPLFLDLTGRRVLVVGGGEVATRRVRRLLAAGAVVSVVAPEVSDEIAADVTHVERRAFAPDDVEGAWLVLACSDDPDVNGAVAAAAGQRGVWCSRADDATASSAWVPAAGLADDVQVAVVAGDPRRAQQVRDHAITALTAGDWPARRHRGRTGKVVLVGGGPGDPGLMTLRGYRALCDADVVVTDRLGPTGLLESLPTDIEVIDVGKDPRGHAAAQEDINALLVQRAQAGDVVVRLKGGDPFVLGRGSEEVEACAAAGVEVEVVPGVTSATSAATLAGVPLTERGKAQEFIVASGHVPPGDPRSSVDWRRLAEGDATIVAMMAVANLRPIADTLMTGGRAADTPAVVVENASLPSQRVFRTTLDRLADVAERERVVPPAVVVIGAVAERASARPDAGDARS
jgi:uroporphyrin-III C-methyltransferase/precorrin-2 dehydrogenase/sirohydrochlorin ferrochelatase